MGFLSHEGQPRPSWWALRRLQRGGSVHRDHPEAGAPTKVHPQQGLNGRWTGARSEHRALLGSDAGRAFKAPVYSAGI